MAKRKIIVPKTLEALEDFLKNRRLASTEAMCLYINLKDDKEFATKFKKDVVKANGKIDLEKAREIFYAHYPHLVIKRQSAISFLDTLVCA